MQAPLKAKYRRWKPVKSITSKGGQSGTKRRVKIGYAAHVKRYGEPPKKVMVVNAGRGTARMQDA